MSDEKNIQWQIRAATNADIGALALVGAATFLETFADILNGDAIVKHCETQHSKSAYDAYLRDGATAWLGELTDGQAPVSYALLCKPELAAAADDGSDIELKRIYSLSRFHGSGMGPALLEKAVNAASKTARRLLLGVYNGNERAIAFYEKQGFEQVATRQFQVGDNLYDDIVFAKTL